LAESHQLPPIPMVLAALVVFTISRPSRLGTGRTAVKLRGARYACTARP